MMFLLTLMVVVSSISVFISLYKYFFFSWDCNPVYLPRELSSFINFVDLFLTRQLWIYVITQFFWPTKSHIEEEDMVHELEKQQEQIDFDEKRKENPIRRAFTQNIGQQQ